MPKHNLHKKDSDTKEDPERNGMNMWSQDRCDSLCYELKNKKFNLYYDRIK
jgi:hypothetical protein